MIEFWGAVQGSSGVTDPAKIEKLCAEGRDAAKFLTQYVVQAELNERGNYGKQPSNSGSRTLWIMHLSIGRLHACFQCIFVALVLQLRQAIQDVAAAKCCCLLLMQQLQHHYQPIERLVCSCSNECGATSLRCCC